jgi:hypothetical protein
LAATSAKLANYVGGRGGKLTWRQYAPNWKITMALDSVTFEIIITPESNLEA